MRKHERADLYIADRNAGLTYREIAKKHGVSHQAVAQACGKYAPQLFKRYTEKEVVYPNLRNWLNENKVSRRELARRMGATEVLEASGRISRWFRGMGFPQKESIDKILKVTGLTYEELWEEEQHDACESFKDCIECWDERAENHPPMTNADRIRAMSDEELAEMLAEEIPHGDCYGCGFDCDDYPGDKFSDGCANAFYRWLQQPAKEEP